MVKEDGVTKFHVHGGGLIIGRIVNELGVAWKVAVATEAAPQLDAAG